MPLLPTTPRQVTVGRIEPIPTVIAETPARYMPVAPPDRHQVSGPAAAGRFEAVRPDGSAGGIRAGSRPADLNAHGLVVAGIADETAGFCPACGRAASAGSRFCRCGATLAVDAVAEEWEDPRERVPWHRRLRDGVGAGARHWRTIRDANQGARARFGQAASMKNLALQLFSIFGVVAVGVGAVSPWSAEARTKVYETVSAALPWSYTTLAADGALTGGTGFPTDPPGTPTPGFEPSLAVDRDLGTAWSTGWVSPSSETGSPCDRQPGAERLVVTFAQPQRIDQVSLAAGLPAGSFDRAQQSRPASVAISLSDGTCRLALLADVATLQPVEISGDGITRITISILRVFEGDGTGGAAALVALTEVVPAYR